MDKTHIEQTDRFVCVSDDGYEVTVLEFTNVNTAPTGSSAPGLARYRTTAGQIVDKKPDGTYEIVFKNGGRVRMVRKNA